jgi:hypothetical protein
MYRDIVSWRRMQRVHECFKEKFFIVICYVTLNGRETRYLEATTKHISACMVVLRNLPHICPHSHANLCVQWSIIIFLSDCNIERIFLNDFSPHPCFRNSIGVEYSAKTYKKMECNAICPCTVSEERTDFIFRDGVVGSVFTLCQAQKTNVNSSPPWNHQISNNCKICEISSSHGGEYDVQSCLLGCTAV